MLIIDLFGGVLWIVSFGLLILSSFVSTKFFKRSKISHKVKQPPISILKPCKGADSGFEENLKSFFQIDYPEYEILFSVADKSDLAIPIIEKIIRDHPGTPARLIVGDTRLGANPKVNNLVRPLDLAAHDLIVISDSNIRVCKNYLKNLCQHLSDDVGLVSSPVEGQSGAGLGGALEEIHLNTHVLRWLILTAKLNRSVPLGKSMLLRKSTIEQFGGLHRLAAYIAEDYMMGLEVRKLGLKVITANTSVQQFIGNHSFKDFWNRHLRWSRIRKAQTPILFFIEPLGSCIFSGLIGALSLGSSFFLEFFLIHIFIWFCFDFYLSRRISDRSGWNFICTWIVREIISIPHWIHASLRSSVRWRNQQLFLKRGGFIEEESLQLSRHPLASR